MFRLLLGYTLTTAPGALWWQLVYSGGRSAFPLGKKTRNAIFNMDCHRAHLFVSLTSRNLKLKELRW